MSGNIEPLGEIAYVEYGVMAGETGPFGVVGVGGCEYLLTPEQLREIADEVETAHGADEVKDA